MNGLLAALWAEGLKVRRSGVLWMSIIFFLFVPCILGLLLFVQKYPEISGKLGLIGTKAAMLRFGNPDWPNYFALVTQFITAIGLIGFGFITSWIFGREFSDRTVKDMLALPVSRPIIVLSKFIIVTIWSILLSLIFYIFTLIIGRIVLNTGWNFEIIPHFSLRFAVSVLLTILLCPPVAFFASYSRGYLLPLGFIILTMIIANFTGLVGIGPYFPWAIPGIYSSPAGTEEIQLSTASYYILILTSLAGLIGTIANWRFSDQK